MRHASSVLTVLLAGALLFGLAGCWSDGELFDQAVWSDDDSGQAYTRLFFEELPKLTPLSQTTHKRNFQHQVYVQNSDGSGRRAVTGVRDHQSGGTLYYMRQAGYLILDVYSDDDVSRYDLIRVATGQATPIVTHTVSRERCASLDVIPSRDGSSIAIVERTAGGDTGSECPGGEAVVTFVDPVTVTSGESYRWPVSDMLQAIWTEAGELIVSSPADGARRVDPAAGPSPTTAPACMFPKTSSGSVSADGVVIGGGMSADDPITVFPPFPTDPSGCE